MGRIRPVDLYDIRELWQIYSQVGGKSRRNRRLQSLCRRTFKVSDVGFLSEEEGEKFKEYLSGLLKKKERGYLRAGRILLKTLSVRQRETLRKENPIHSSRNRLLVSLKNDGVSFELLSRISGLGKTQLYMIVKKWQQNKR